MRNCALLPKEGLQHLKMCKALFDVLEDNAYFPDSSQGKCPSCLLLAAIRYALLHVNTHEQREK